MTLVNDISKSPKWRVLQQFKTLGSQGGRIHLFHEQRALLVRKLKKVGCRVVGGRVLWVGEEEIGGAGWGGRTGGGMMTFISTYLLTSPL